MGARGSHVTLFYTEEIDSFEPVALAVYSSDDKKIWIKRSPEPEEFITVDPAGASLVELITLAHEIGHLESDLAGTYVRTLDPDVTFDDAMEEERRAWRIGWPLLHKDGFADRSAFDAAREVGLQNAEIQFRSRTVGLSGG